MGANLDDLTPETRMKLQKLANEADVDIGINATANGSHSDPGHRNGTAVDIGWINGKDIGSGSRTNSGMTEQAARLQKTAAQLGGLTERGNLGPAGKYNGTTGPLRINDPAIRASHKNHIHLSYSDPEGE